MRLHFQTENAVCREDGSAVLTHSYLDSTFFQLFACQSKQLMGACIDLTSSQTPDPKHLTENRFEEKQESNAKSLPSDHRPDAQLSDCSRATLGFCRSGKTTQGQQNAG